MTRKTWSQVEVSAYLDGELTPKHQAALEADMARDPDLHRRVEALRSLTTMVRAVPLRQPPRNYIVTPSMVAEPEPEPARRRRPIWVMRLATSLVAAAFVITFGFTLLQQGVTPNLATQSREAPQVSLMRESEAMSDAAVPEPESTPELAGAPDAVVEQEAPAAAEMAEESTPLSPEDEMAFAPMPEAGESAEDMEGLGVGGGGDAPAEQEIEQPEAEEAAAEKPAAEEPAEPPMALVAPAEPEEETPVEDAEVVKSAPPEAVEETQAPAEAPVPPPQDAGDGERRTAARPPRSVPLGVTIGLGIATVILTAVTIWLSRRQAG